jgi:hypothetical protein
VHACAEYAKKLSPEELKEKLRLDIDDVARLKALQGCEIPRDFIVEMEPFSKENHLLTDSGKLATGRLKKRCAHLFSQGPNLVMKHMIPVKPKAASRRGARLCITQLTVVHRLSVHLHYCDAPEINSWVAGQWQLEEDMRDLPLPRKT